MEDDKSDSIPLINHPLVDRLLPTNRRNVSGIEELRARVLVLSALVVTVWGPIFALLYWYHDERALAGIFGLTTLSVGPVLYMCLKHRTVALGGVLLGLILFGLLFIISAKTGGITSSALKWLTIVPPLAYIFGARRAFVGLIVMVVAAIAFFALAPSWGWQFASVISPEERQMNHIVGLFALAIVLPELFVLNSGLQQWLADRVRGEEAEKRQIEAQLRQAQQQALVRSQRSLQGLIDRSPDGIVVFRDGRVVTTNPAFRKMMGYTGDAALVSSLLVSMVASDDRGEFAAMLDQIAAGEEAAYRDICFLRADGESVVAEVTGTVGVHDGERACFCLVRDVTEQRRVQGKMMQLDRMNAVGTLAAGVAHEINNPLAYVHSNAEYLLSLTSKYRQTDTDSGGSDLLGHDELVEALEDIREGTERIRAIVTDLGTFSKQEQQAVRPLDVRELLESSLKMAENQLRHRARVATDFEEVPAVEANEANLAQVFLNLVVNAAQAIPEGAVEQNEITVATRYDVASSQVVVEVCDTGTGIPSDIRARIFDPFFSTKGQDEGMGLGLFICRNIVREHGGDITFETTPGVGTTFRVELPGSDTQASASGEFESPVIADGFEGRALIIDDEKRVCRTVERVLGSSYHTITVNSGREALELLERDHSFEVVVCDLLMPDVSGVEVFEEVKARYPRLAERMVFVTGGTFTERTNQFVASTSQPVIIKPFDIKEFREVVDEVASV